MKQEQKDMVRDWLVQAVETLPAEIEKSIEEIGGKDMLLQRIDVMYWVYIPADVIINGQTVHTFAANEEEVRMYKEALRLLDDEKEIDESLIRAAIQRKKCDYQNTLAEIRDLQRLIAEKQEQLERDQELAPQIRSSIEALEEALKEHRGQAK